jgi:hypothetical protein
MEHYVGLDVSLKLAAICIVDRTEKIEREGVVASDRSLELRARERRVLTLELPRYALERFMVQAKRAIEEAPLLSRGRSSG